MVWDDETIRQLRDLWAQGLSTAEIGRRLGVSKNAIVGKAHRLDLNSRPSPIRRDVTKPVIERLASCPRPAGPTLPPLASAVVHPIVPLASNVQPLRAPSVASPRPAPVTPSSGAASLGAVNSGASSLGAANSVTPSSGAAPRPAIPAAPVQPRRSAPSCCWPIGEPGTKTFRFCDDTSVHGKPYCDEHAKLAYVRIRDRKEDAA